MKKIAVISGGLLPIPSVKGGAIETLLQYFIDYNEENKSFELEVYSIFDDNALRVSKNYKNTKFHYISLNKTKSNLYYNYCRVIRKLGYKDPNFQKLYIKEVCKKLKKGNYDLIFIESDNHFVLPIKKVTDAPIVLYLHNDKLNKDTKNNTKIIDACNQVLTVSEYIKSCVLTIDKELDKKVTSILNGINTSNFKLENKEEVRNNLRKQYNLKEDDFVFLFTGRIEPNKGVLELIKAFNLIKNERAKLLIIGGRFFSSNKKTKYIKTLELEMEGNDNIIVTGYINYKDIPLYHVMSDCMVSPSQWEEPGSLVNQEAFASGLPLISSYSGGTPEYTKDTEAILIKRNSDFVKNLYEAMDNLIENKQLQNKMRESELKVSPYFSKERYCEDLKDYLKKV